MLCNNFMHPCGFFLYFMLQAIKFLLILFFEPNFFYVYEVLEVKDVFLFEGMMSS